MHLTSGLTLMNIAVLSFIVVNTQVSAKQQQKLPVHNLSNRGANIVSLNII